jgi:glycogen operon protein
VLQAGFDGFRFDLATIMGRTETGFSPSAPLLQAIENDPVLSTRIMIAEPWDIGPGGYQLGQFPKRWLEWNDRFRDDARRFWRGDEFSSNAMATRLAGSSDVFTGTRSRSVNFIAAHDGFTLRDLTIYDQKNNLANGENNRDGKNNEVACINTRPENLLATLLLTRGTAMITAGDEFGRTQAGNNNAYAQDNETTWLDWQNADKALIEKVATLIAQRKSVPISDDLLEPSSADWLDGNNNPINWADPNNPVLTLKIRNNYSVTLNRNTGTVSLSTKS